MKEKSFVEPSLVATARDHRRSHPESERARAAGRPARGAPAALGRLLSLAALACLALVAAAGCQAEGVGDPCTPENIPEGGFKETEVYLETSSLQCRTRVCLVYRFQGDPSVTEGRTPEEEQGIYCTCRCGSDQPGARLCECPEGYECREIFQTGGAGVRGSYCVLKGT